MPEKQLDVGDELDEEEADLKRLLVLTEVRCLPEQEQLAVQGELVVEPEEVEPSGQRNFDFSRTTATTCGSSSKSPGGRPAAPRPSASVGKEQ